MSDSYTSRYRYSSPSRPRRIHSGAGQHAARTAAPRHRGGRGILIACILIALIAVAWWAVGHFYFADRAPLGTSFAGQSLAGQSRAQVRATVEKKASSTRLTFTASGRSPVTLSYQQLGVQPNIAHTVANVMTARGSNPFAKVWPFGSHNIPLTAAINDRSAVDSLNSRILTAGDHMIEPSISYQSSTHTFVPTEGKSGLSVSTTQVHAAIVRSLNTSASHPVNTTVSINTIAPSIPNSSATTLATQANARLKTNYTISNGRTKSVRIPVDVLASWMSAQPDSRTHQLSLAINKSAVTAWIDQNVPNAIAVAPVDQHDLYTPEGRKIAVKNVGRSGLKVKTTASAATSVISGLQSGAPVLAVADMETDPYKVVKDTVPHNFSVPNGDPWVQIDLSKQTLTTYKGTTKVASYPVATGKAGHETPDGTFYVYLRYDTQTMHGPGYVSPGVRYINYFTGSVATHAAPWNVGNINAGRPSSHGCVNMLPQDALAVYNFAPLGTMVQVTGKAPSTQAR